MGVGEVEGDCGGSGWVGGAGGCGVVGVRSERWGSEDEAQGRGGVGWAVPSIKWWRGVFR